MEIWKLALILGVGFVAGWINTIAAGGSLLTLPALIFLGLPPQVANATNRVAIMAQNIFSVAGYKSKGVSAYPYSLWLGISAFFGGIIGAQLALEIKDELFNRILAIIMVVVVIYIIIDNRPRKSPKVEKMGTIYQILGIIAFFFVGIYGGFIQAGVGFLMLPVLTGINGFSLVKSNSAKVFVSLFFTLSALAIFIYEDQIDWAWGISLAVGNSAGGWFASRWSVTKGDVWIKRFLMVTVTAMAIKLWFF